MIIWILFAAVAVIGFAPDLWRDIAWVNQRVPLIPLAFGLGGFVSMSALLGAMLIPDAPSTTSGAFDAIAYLATALAGLPGVILFTAATAVAAMGALFSGRYF